MKTTLLRLRDSVAFYVCRGQAEAWGAVFWRNSRPSMRITGNTGACEVRQGMLLIMAYMRIKT